MSLGARIRDLRQSRELTQRELATAVGKNSPYLSKIENDREKPSESLIHAVADALGVDVNELLLLAGRVPPEFREALRRGPDLPPRTPWAGLAGCAWSSLHSKHGSGQNQRCELRSSGQSGCLLKTPWPSSWADWPA